MRNRFRKITACLLLAVWPITIGLATGWHVHDHGGACESGRCSQDLAETDHPDHSRVGHHHAGHTHSHQLADPHRALGENSPENPAPPGDSDGCRSCEILALTGSVSTIALAELEAELLQTLDVTVESLVSSLVPSCFYLRGPPAGMIV